jgi:hypothetical protein
MELLMNRIILAFSFMFLASCAHHRDVRPGVSGVHKVAVLSEDESSGQRDALSQANHFCDKKYEKSAAIVKEKTTYTGSMDESNYKMGKAASRALKTGGNSAWVLGGKKESNAGRTASGSGSVLDSALGEGYTTQMIFKCI